MKNGNLVKAKGRILVNTDLKTAFDFFVNPTNDSAWRSEINQSRLDTTLQVGATVFEYSHLSRKASNHLIELKCVRLEPNQIAIFETPANVQFYEKSKREVKAISRQLTEIIYTLEFDKKIVKFALGFSIPKFIISLKANRDMKKYLRQLKATLESEVSKPGTGSLPVKIKPI